MSFGKLLFIKGTQFLSNTDQIFPTRYSVEDTKSRNAMKKVQKKIFILLVDHLNSLAQNMHYPIKMQCIKCTKHSFHAQNKS